MRRRLLGSMVAVTVIAVVVFGVPLGWAAARLYRDREVSRLQQEATRAAGSLPAGGLNGADAIELPRPPAGVRLALYDVNDRRVAGFGPLRGGSEVRAAIVGRVTDDHDGSWLAVAVPLHDEERVVGAARAAVPWDSVARDTRVSWMLMASIALGAVLLAGAVARGQASRLVEPVNGVAALAVRLGNGDFTARLAPSGVPELDQAADALNRTASRLGDLLARERAFTADVTHQLNTPLTSLRLGLESALLTPGLDARTALENAVFEVDRLQVTVTTLLAVALDRPPGADETADAAGVCAEVAERSRGPLAAAGRRLQVDAEDDLPAARCPQGVLREILAVLIDNAVAHGAGTVSVATRGSGSGIIIDVADQGPGIQASTATLFQRRSPDASGHGIGLSLARSLAEAHGARLELTRSRPHPVFTIALAGASPADL